MTTELDSRFGSVGLDEWEIAPPNDPPKTETAAAFSRACCSGHFASLDPSDFPAWITKAIAAHAGALRRLVRVIARPFAGLLPASGESRERALNAVRETIVDAMAAGDLGGRAEILAEAGVEPEPIGSIEEGGTGTVPHVPFGEAVRDMVKRHPELAENAEAVANRLLEGR